MRTPVRLPLAATLAALLVAPAALASPPGPFPVGPAVVDVAFDATALETPESVAFDLQGNMYVSLALTGEIRKIAPDGTQTSLAFLPLGVADPNAPLPGIMGAIDIRIDGTLFVSVASADPAAKGVYSVSPTGVTTQLTTLPPNALPNGIALRFGLLHVADSALGVVWRVPVEGGPAEVWIDDPNLLAVPGPIAIAPGANGIQFFRREAYVCNSSAGTIWAYPVDRHGDAGSGRLHAENVPCDDFAFDIRGNLFVTTDPFNTLILVRPDGTQEILLDASDGLDGPTAAAFGRVFGERRTLYITNAAFPFFTTTFNPTVMRVDLPFPGAPSAPW